MTSGVYSKKQAVHHAGFGIPRLHRLVSLYPPGGCLNISPHELIALAGGHINVTCCPLQQQPVCARSIPTQIRTRSCTLCFWPIHPPAQIFCTMVMISNYLLMTPCNWPGVHDHCHVAFRQLSGPNGRGCQHGRQDEGTNFCEKGHSCRQIAAAAVTTHCQTLGVH